MNTDPPAIRWVRDGEHAGFYVYIPVWRKWRRFGLNGAGEPLGLEPVTALPEGSEALYDGATVGHALDAYRLTLEDIQENTEHAITELGGISDMGHDEAKATVLAELRDSDDYAVCAVDAAHERRLGQPAVIHAAAMAAVVDEPLAGLEFEAAMRCIYPDATVDKLMAAYRAALGQEGLCDGDA